MECEVCGEFVECLDSRHSGVCLALLDCYHWIVFSAFALANLRPLDFEALANLAFDKAVDGECCSTDAEALERWRDDCELESPWDSEVETTD